MKPKVMDVRRPGAAPANPTSKPIIVSDKPKVQDRSVTLNRPGDPRATPPPKGPRKIEISSSDAPEQSPPSAPVDVSAASEPDPEPVSPADAQTEAPEEEIQAIGEALLDETVEAPEIVISKHAAHHGSGKKTALLIVVAVLLALLIVNLLLDAGVIDAGVPHTDLF